MAVAIISLFVLHEESCGAADHYPVFVLFVDIADSERDMASATISVRCMHLITGTADKDSWEGCHERRVCIYCPFFLKLSIGSILLRVDGSL